MNVRKDYRQDGYQKGFTDGKRTGGKVKKIYIDNFFKEETRKLSSEDSLEFMKGWNEGLADGVIGIIDNRVKNEVSVKNNI